MRFTLVPLVLAVAALAATAAPAAAYRTCDIQGDSWTNHSTWYITSMAVRHATCGKGRRVVLAFQRCRHKHGRRGRCHHRVLHFRCRETRGYGQGQFTSRVICRHNRKRVRHTYTQFT